MTRIGVLALAIGAGVVALPAVAAASEPAPLAPVIALSEPEVDVLCRNDGGTYRWLEEMQLTLDRLSPVAAAPPPPSPVTPRGATNAASAAKAPEAAPSDSPAPAKPAATPAKQAESTRALSAWLEAATAHLPRACAQLIARRAIDQADLRAIERAYGEWSASGLAGSQERDTIYAQKQARNQLQVGLSRGGSSRGGGGGSLETSLLQGTKAFLAKRADEELTFFMLEVLQKRLCADRRAADSVPFDNVCRVLTGSDDLPASSAALSRAARADVSNLSRWLTERLLTNEKTKDVACALDIAQAFTAAARDGQPIFDVVTDVKTLNGLMWRSASCKTMVDKIEPLVQATALARSFPSFSGLRAEGSYDLLVSLATVNMVNPPVAEASEVLKRLDSLASVAASSRGIAGQESPAPRAALGVLVPILARATGDKMQADALTRAMTALLREDYPDTFVQLLTIEAVRDRIGKRSVELGLIAELANAQTSGDVAAILEHSALPLGSWRRKNVSRLGLTLTGMVGLHLNYERVTQKSRQGSELRSVAPGTAVGAAAFLGVDAHYGLCKLARVGLFAPFLDFGAITSTRVSAPNQEEVNPNKGAEVGIEQLLSPGLYGYVGLGPITLGGGASWVPALRGVSSAAQDEQLTVVRYGGFAAVDVSILPLL